MAHRHAGSRRQPRRARERRETESTGRREGGTIPGWASRRRPSQRRPSSSAGRRPGETKVLPASTPPCWIPGCAPTTGRRCPSSRKVGGRVAAATVVTRAGGGRAGGAGQGRAAAEAEEEAARLGHPGAQDHPQAGVAAARVADRLLRAVLLLPLPDGVPRHLRGAVGRRRCACRCRSKAFLLADPFVAAMTLLSDAHRLPRPRSGRSVVVALTLVFGRVFCGWICPFGTLHHFFGLDLSVPLREGQLARRGEQDARLAEREVLPDVRASCAAAVAGSAIGGLFDPICVAVRAIGLGVIPALQYMAHRGIDAVAGPATCDRSRRRPTARKTCSRSSCGAATSSTSTRPGSSSSCSSRSCS